MGNTSDFNKDNISKQRTFQPNHENINLSKMFRNSPEVKPNFKVNSPSNLIPKVQKSILFLLLKRLSQVIRSELL